MSKPTAILSLSEMLADLDGIGAELTEIGYEQADSNEEHSTDFGDAIRILCESEKYSQFCPESVTLLGTVAALKCLSFWESEFGIEG